LPVKLPSKLKLAVGPELALGQLPVINNRESELQAVAAAHP
jgi:hypothetical protein